MDRQVESCVGLPQKDPGHRAAVPTELGYTTLQPTDMFTSSEAPSLGTVYYCLNLKPLPPPPRMGVELEVPSFW